MNASDAKTLNTIGEGTAHRDAETYHWQVGIPDGPRVLAAPIYRLEKARLARVVVLPEGPLDRAACLTEQGLRLVGSDLVAASKGGNARVG